MELEVDNVSITPLATAGVAVLIAAIIGIGIQQTPSDDIRDYRIESPSPLKVLGKDINTFKADMHEAKLVYSGDENTDRFKRVDREITWKFLPKKTPHEELPDYMPDKDIRPKEFLKESKFTVRVDRSGTIVGILSKEVFKDIEVFRKVYLLEILHKIDLIGTNSSKITCYNIEPSFLRSESDDVERFELDEEEAYEWKQLRRCEQVSGRGINESGLRKRFNYILRLNILKEPKERTKKSDENRYIKEIAGFKGGFKGFK